MPHMRSALIIEFAHVRRSLLSELLQELGYGFVIEAVSQLNAIERLEMLSFDIVFIEASASDDSGFALIRRIRLDHRRNHRVPIVVVSSDRQRSLIERARDAGAHGFLAKPFSRSSLAAQIAHARSDLRAFIDAATYSGPDRRRGPDPNYVGPERRGGGAEAYYVA